MGSAGARGGVSSSVFGGWPPMWAPASAIAVDAQSVYWSDQAGYIESTRK
jgi:hypothetical protein